MKNEETYLQGIKAQNYIEKLILYRLISFLCIKRTGIPNLIYRVIINLCEPIALLWLHQFVSCNVYNLLYEIYSVKDK